MPTNPKPPAKAKVQTIAPMVMPTVELPGEWHPNTAFGFMACDKSTAGRLVRLADVLRWIESTQSIPRMEALQVLCTAMPPEIMQWLHWIKANDYSKPVPVNFGFGYQSAEQIARDNAQARQEAIDRDWENRQRTWDGFRPGLAVTGGRRILTDQEPTEPGLPALLKALNRSWSTTEFNRSATVDILDDPRRSSLTQLAITLEKAAEIWGYGRVSDAAPVPSIHVAEEWTGERLTAQQALFKAAGHRDFAKRTWVLAGIKERDGRRLVSEYEATKKNNAVASKAVVSTVFNLGKAVAKKTKKRA